MNDPHLIQIIMSDLDITHKEADALLNSGIKVDVSMFRNCGNVEITYNQTNLRHDPVTGNAVNRSEPINTDIIINLIKNLRNLK